MADDIEILPVEINLPGLLKLLGQHLYSDPRVALRELTQNAHDSCVRRRQEDGNVAEAYTPAIHIYVDHDARQLLVEDNGSGLTRDEITTFLATVGRGYTGELRERLTTAGRSEAMDLIGLFGLGLLSAFMIASRIDISTTSYKEPEIAWRWVSEGGQSYALRRTTRERVGTTVRLDLRDDARFLLEPNALADVLRVYAEFLPIPIYIAHATTPLNGATAPWIDEPAQEQSRVGRYAAWIEERLGVRPLTALPLTDVTLDDGRVVPIRGVLFVPPRSVISLQEFGDVIVYVRHMLITERERELLPEWARFVTGVIDSPALNPTASRETLRHDEIFEAVRDALASQLLAHFEYLARSAPMDWAAIVQAHNDLVKGWAVRSPELFLRVADLVTFKTSRGQLTLPEYLRENPGRIYYYHDDDGVTQALALYEARRLAVVDARWFADTAFLKRYGEVYGLTVEELEPGAGYLFAPVRDDEGVWRSVVAQCASGGLPVRLVAFEPEHLPMILLYPPGAERLRRAQRNMGDGRYSGPIRRLVRSYLDTQEVDEASLNGVLHLNTRNPLLRRVRDFGPEDAKFGPLLGVLVANARVFAGQGLSAQDAIACFEQINLSLARLIGVDDAVVDALTPTTLVDLGLRPDAAARICAQCETVESFLAADLEALAARAQVSPLMLATVREELLSRAGGVTRVADTAPESANAEAERAPVAERQQVVQLRIVRRDAVPETSGDATGGDE